MPTPKDAIKNAKLDLSLVEDDPNYTAWRNKVKDYCTTNDIRSKVQADAAPDFDDRLGVLHHQDLILLNLVEGTSPV